MPRISEFYGIAIYMYWNDHEPPHFHALYQGEEALFAIADGTLAAGTLPRTAARLVRAWAAFHRGALLRNWQRARAHRTLRPIEGLE